MNRRLGLPFPTPLKYEFSCIQRQREMCIALSLGNSCGNLMGEYFVLKLISSYF